MIIICICILLILFYKKLQRDNFTERVFKNSEAELTPNGVFKNESETRGEPEKVFKNESETRGEPEKVFKNLLGSPLIKLW
jgi:hypothetical protein